MTDLDRPTRRRRRSTEPVEGAAHGTRRGYTQHGCGCDACYSAERTYWDGYNARLRGGAV